MTMMHKAIGYIRRDISRTRQQWDETQIRSLAARSGYDLCKILVLGPQTDLTKRVRVSVSRAGAVAIFVPTLAHFEGGIPDEIREAAAVIAVDTGHTIPRWPARTQTPS